MAIESPLFQSSMELLGHSISHFNSSEELDRKLVILHLANAIELILKDLALDAGESIYKNPKETITIHGCIHALKEKNVSIPFLNKIELLIDERNALQHRFGSPNELTTIFYMNISTEFFRQILKTNYDQDFEEILSQFIDEKSLFAFKMREPTSDSELDNLKKLANVHPLGALLSAVTYLETSIEEFSKKVNLDKIDRRHFFGPLSYRALLRYGFVPPTELQEKMDEVRKTRNLAAHGRKDPTKTEVCKIINHIEEYENYLNSIDIEQALIKVESYIITENEKS